MDKNLLKLFNELEEFPKSKKYDGERILMIDGLNLFFRNFAVLNYINKDGIHIGGIGGFLRSLGGLIKQLNPTQIYIIFDGAGSSTNRKNLLPEYKSGRGSSITNRFIFKKIEDEDESKSNQIIRLIQYLKCLPVKIISLDKVEADDIIAFLSKELTKNKKIHLNIISSDNDFIQLVDENISLYRSVEKEFYTPEFVKEKFGTYPDNFIIYKTLIGDNSDKIGGIRGLGKTKIYNLFPSLKEKNKISMDDIYEICSEKFKEHILYAKIIDEFEKLQKAFKLMDLNNPMLDSDEKEYLLNQIHESSYELNIPAFVKMYNEDGLGHVLKNVNFWIKENFELINRYNKAKNIK